MPESEGEKRESHSQSDLGECLGDTAKIFLSSWLKMLNFSKSFISLWGMLSAHKLLIIKHFVCKLSLSI